MLDKAPYSPLLQHHIGIQHADEFSSAVRDTEIVAFAKIKVLFHHSQIYVAEFFTNYINRVIIRVVVNHNDLDVWVILRSNRIQTVPDIALAVIGDDEAAHKRGVLVL
jgi:hypothetical protein